MSDLLDRKLAVRTATAAVLIALGALVLWLGSLAAEVLQVAVCVIAVAIGLELLRIGRRPSLAIAMAPPFAAGWLCVLPLLAWQRAAGAGWVAGLAAIALLAILAAVAWNRRRHGRRAGAAALVAAYLGAALAHTLALADLDTTVWAWFLFLFGTVAVSDTMAYFGGRLAGRRKLAPAISPNKTQEGALIGVACGAGAAALLMWLLPLELNWAAGLGLGAAIAVIGVGGDLVESWLKRAAEVKDSGNLVAGHGGVLDRLDAVLPAAVAVYWVARVV